MSTLKTAVIQTLVSITAMQCPTCGIHYGLDEGFRRRALEDSKLGWCCTAGHSLAYVDSALDRARKQMTALESRLQAEQGWSQRLSERLETSERSLAVTRGVVTRQRNRVQNGVCLFCHRHFASLERHIKTKHLDEMLTNLAKGWQVEP